MGHQDSAVAGAVQASKWAAHLRVGVASEGQRDRLDWYVPFVLFSSSKLCTDLFNDVILSYLCLFWGPHRLIVADVLGKFSVWRNPIPVASYNVPPNGGETTLAQAAATTQADLSSLFDDDPDDIDAIRRRRMLKV